MPVESHPECHCGIIFRWKTNSLIKATSTNEKPEGKPESTLPVTLFSSRQLESALKCTLQSKCTIEEEKDGHNSGLKKGPSQKDEN